MTKFKEPDFEGSPFKLNKALKDQSFTEDMVSLTAYHYERCNVYKNMLDATDYRKRKIMHYADIPYIPVGLFKELTLSSLEEDQEFKTATSSGTTGQRTSQIILDGNTRILQQKALASIAGDFIGNRRLPMLVIDTEATIRKRDHFSARTSGILGFSIFARKRIFVLNEDMSLNTDVLRDFLNEYGDKPFLIFGFTYIVWQHFCQVLKNMDERFNLSNGRMIHGGGWKKLIGQAVSKQAFKAEFESVCGLHRIHDYYGMAEQTGSIFMECECGHFHVSDYSAVLFRRASDFSLCDIGEKGIIQVMSLLPESYPGHSILTEDEGILLGRDDCGCMRKGDYFEVTGRIKNAEIRGCSDTYGN